VTTNWEHRIRTTYRRQLIAAKAIIDGYARIGETITYRRLEQMIGLADRVSPAVRNALLELISLDSDAEGGGLITVVVLHGNTGTPDDGKPGTGFLAIAASVGRDISDPDALYAYERDYVFAHAQREGALSSIY